MSALPPLRPSFDAALRDVAAKQPEMRVAALERLGEATGDISARACDAVRVLLDDVDARVRAAALEAAALLRDASAMSVVLARFADGEPRVREAAVIAAGKLGGPAALDALRDALTSVHPEVRFQAIASIAEQAPAWAVEEIATLLTDSDAEVRANAASSLGTLRAFDCVPHLVEALNDPDKRMRLEVALALVALGSSAGIPVLRHAVIERQDVLRAMDALGVLGSEAAAAAPDLRRVAFGWIEALTVRAAAGAALVRVGDRPSGVDALRRVLTAWRSDGRPYAVELAESLGLVELVPELVALRTRGRGVEREAVESALATLSGGTSDAQVAFGSP